jgi:hypothetical protein
VSRLVASAVVLLTACGGSTGSALVRFSAAAGGPADATGGPLAFTSGQGAQLVLDRAHLHLGAVYLNQSVPTSGAAAAPCINPGVYVGEAFGPVELDLLSPALVPFPTSGEGTQTTARTGEVWLTQGDVDALTDSTVILDLAGTATQDGGVYPFTASVTISSNRTPVVSDPALPGASPICHQRIVSPILVDLTPTEGGTLTVRADPRAMFNGLDFTALGPPGAATYAIPDDAAGAGGALFRGLHSNFGVYAFTWADAP